jgi:hypothetical protein
MFVRLATTTAFSLLMATPGFADCSRELKALEQAVVTAETGASTNESGMSATEHQEEVLQGNQQDSGTETTGSTGGKVEAISPHQKQVMGLPSGQSSTQVSELMAEAGKLAEAGDEPGCMNKVSELKTLLGAK